MNLSYAWICPDTEHKWIYLSPLEIPPPKCKFCNQETIRARK